MRRSPTAIALVMALSLLAACGTTKTGSPASNPPTTSPPSTAPSTPDQPVDTPDSIPSELAPVPKRTTPLAATVTCEYPADTQSPPAKPNQPPPTADISAQGTAAATMSLSSGDVTLTLDRALAPCTVNSFVSLAKQGYYDDTPCHRLTTSGIKVLQCGDPSGQGSGGPGYSFKDEVFPELTYGRGILAMANAGPDTNGSQFFIVYGESPLPPKYTVFGTLNAESMRKIDEIAKAGAVSQQPGAGDGPPKNPVTIKRMVVAG